jgi:pyrophosphatase PpaX
MNTFEILDNYKTILFDWDGCLAMTLHNWLSTYSEIYAKHGLCITNQNILLHSWGNLVEGPKFFGMDNPEETWKEIVENVTVKNSMVGLYPGARTLLMELQKLNKNLVIVTSSEMKIVKPALEFNELSLLFSKIYTDDMVNKPKPDPEIALLALKELSSNKNESIIIGDTSKDILCGKNAGIDTMLVLHKENMQFYDFEKMKESDPTFIVKRF